MSEYLNMLHEIEDKKAELEKSIADLVGAEIAKFQSENSLAVKSVYINLTNVTSVGDPKRYIVTGASIDLDYKP